MEDYFKINDVLIHYSYRKSNLKAPTILFIHGLGENSQCFTEVFEFEWSSNYNIIIPDLPGFGKSTDAQDYSFKMQIERLNKLLEFLNVEKCIVIGHSMGGDLATMMCFNDHIGRIKKIVNIEGSLTVHDLFISKKIVDASNLDKFDNWFEDFKEKIVLNQWGKKYSSCKRYYNAFKQTGKKALIKSANEIINSTNQIGELYKQIKIPKIFCYGTESLSFDTLDFLRSNNLESIAFKNAFHWPMIDNKNEFYCFLNEWLKS